MKKEGGIALKSLKSPIVRIGAIVLLALIFTPTLLILPQETQAETGLNVDQYCVGYPVDAQDKAKRGRICEFTKITNTSTSMGIDPEKDIWGGSGLVEKGFWNIIRGIFNKVLSPWYFITCNALDSMINSNFDPNMNATFDWSKARCVIDDSKSTYKVGEASVVTRTLAGELPKDNPWVKSLFSKMRIAFNILLVIALIAIALANILHISLDTYAIKKMLPTVLVTAVVANVALPIIALVSRVVDSLYAIVPFSPINIANIYNLILGGAFAGGSVLLTGVGIGAGIFGASSAAFLAATGGWLVACILGVLILIVPAILVIILDFILAFRPYVVYLAAGLSPLACALAILPQTQQWFKKWLGILVPWLLMPVLVNAIFYLASLIPQATPSSGGSSAEVLIGFVLPIILKSLLVLFAIRLPFTIEKDITGAITKATKFLGEKGWQGIGGTAAAAYHYDSRKQREARVQAGKEYDIDKGPNEDQEKELMSFRLANLRKANAKLPESERKKDEDMQKEATQSIADDRETPEGRKKLQTDFVDSRLKKYEGSLGHKVLQVPIKYNPYGVVASLQQRWKIAGEERTKTSDKYAKIAPPLRGHLGELKYRAEVAKSDFTDVHTLDDKFGVAFQGGWDGVMASAAKYYGLEGEENLEKLLQKMEEVLGPLRKDAKGPRDFGNLPWPDLGTRELAYLSRGTYELQAACEQAARRVHVPRGKDETDEQYEARQEIVREQRKDAIMARKMAEYLYNRPKPRPAEDVVPDPEEAARLEREGGAVGDVLDDKEVDRTVVAPVRVPGDEELGGGPAEGEEGGTPIAPPSTVNLDAEAKKLLGGIATAIRTQGQQGQAVDPSLLAMQVSRGIKPGDVISLSPGFFSQRNALLLLQMRNQLTKIGKADTGSAITAALEHGNFGQAKEIVATELRADPGAQQQLLDAVGRYQTNRVGELAVTSKTERVIAENSNPVVTAKIDPNSIEGVRQAANKVLGESVGIRVDPNSLQQAKEQLKQYTGGIALNVKPEAAAKISEGATVRGPMTPSEPTAPPPAPGQS